MKNFETLVNSLNTLAAARGYSIRCQAVEGVGVKFVTIAGSWIYTLEQIAGFDSLDFAIIAEKELNSMGERTKNAPMYADSHVEQFEYNEKLRELAALEAAGEISTTTTTEYLSVVAIDRASGRVESHDPNTPETIDEARELEISEPLDADEFAQAVGLTPGEMMRAETEAAETAWENANRLCEVCGNVGVTNHSYACPDETNLNNRDIGRLTA